MFLIFNFSLHTPFIFPFMELSDVNILELLFYFIFFFCDWFQFSDLSKKKKKITKIEQKDHRNLQTHNTKYLLIHITITLERQDHPCTQRCMCVSMCSSIIFYTIVEKKENHISLFFSSLIYLHVLLSLCAYYTNM